MLRIEGNKLQSDGDIVNTRILFKLMQVLGYDSTSKAEKAYIIEELTKEMNDLEETIKFIREGLELNKG